MFLAEQCLDCHQGDSAEGGLDLEGVSQGVSGGLDFLNGCGFTTE